MNTSKQLMLIVNPAAGGYSTKREWANIKKYFEEKMELSYDCCETEYPGHAIILTKKAISNYITIQKIVEATVFSLK